MTKKRKTGLADHVNLEGLSLDLDAPKKSEPPIQIIVQQPKQEPEQRGFVGPEIDFDNGVHAGSKEPAVQAVKPKPVSAVRSETAMSANKIANAEREKTEAAKKKTAADEKALKQSDELRKSIEKLTKTLMSTTRSDVDPSSGGAPKPENSAIDHRTQSLRKTLGSAVKGAVVGKINPIKEITSKRGIFGAVAARYGADPNSIIGNVFGALHERESNKRDEIGRKEDFHTGFLTGTDRGRDLLKAHTDTAYEKIKKENPKLSDEKAMALAKKQAMVSTRKTTSTVYDARAEKENELAELNQKQASLKAKGAGFELSADELKRQSKLQDVVKEIGTTGRISESDSEIKQRHTAAAMLDLGTKEKGETPQKTIEREEMLLATLQSIDAMGKEELNYLRKTFDVIKGDKPSAETLMEKANEDNAKIVASETRTNTPKPLPTRSKGFLEKGKDLLGKGKSVFDSIKDTVIDKIGGGLMGKVGGSVLSAVSGVAAPALAVAGAGAAGYGLGTMINNASGDDGNRLSDKLSGLFTSDEEKKANASLQASKQGIPLSPEKLAAFKARQIAAVSTAPVMEKVGRDVKPEIDEKSAQVEKAKAERPVVVNSTPVSAPIITNNSTTNVVRTPIRNQEPSFNKTLQKNFV